MSTNSLDNTKYNTVIVNTVNDAVIDAAALAAWRQDVKNVVNKTGTDMGDMATATTTSKIVAGAINELNSNKWLDNTLSVRSAFRAFQSVAQALTAGVSTKLQFPNESYDQQTEYDNATNFRFTAKNKGLYLIVASTVLQPPPAGSLIALTAKVNGTDYAYLHQRTTSGGPNNDVISGSAFVLLNPNDYVEIYGYCSSAISTIASLPGGCFFEVIRIA